MLGPRDRENPMRETTAYRAISISSHMVGIPGHCEKDCDFKIRNDEIQHWDPTGGHGTPREATGPNGRPRDPTPGHSKSACQAQLIHYQDRQDPYRASSVWGKTKCINIIYNIDMHRIWYIYSKIYDIYDTYEIYTMI